MTEIPGSSTDGEGAPPQLTRADLKTMTPDEIVAARKAGQLADLTTPRDRK